MRLIVTLTFLVGLWGCTTTQTTTTEHTSIVEFAYAVAYTDRAWSNRPIRAPKRTTSSSMSTIQFRTDVYGERIIERLSEFCIAKGFVSSNRIRSIYGASQPLDFIEGLRRIERNANSRPVSRPGETAQSVGGPLKTVSCTRGPVSPTSPSWHEVEWFAFAIPSPYFSELQGAWSTQYEFLIAERESVEMKPFLFDVSSFLQSY